MPYGLCFGFLPLVVYFTPLAVASSMIYADAPTLKVIDVPDEYVGSFVIV